MIQLHICLSTSLSMALLSMNNKALAKWGFVVGLFAQPAWIYETYNKDQIGMLILSIVHTIILMNGIRNNFRKAGTSGEK